MSSLISPPRKPYLANAQTIIDAGAQAGDWHYRSNSRANSNSDRSMCQKKLGGIIAPNFSLGAVLMMKYAQDAASYLPNVEIIEMHHPQKLDAPSGTAIKTAHMIAHESRRQ